MPPAIYENKETLVIARRPQADEAISSLHEIASGAPRPRNDRLSQLRRVKLDPIRQMDSDLAPQIAHED
jgi:hypothetical protein